MERSIYLGFAILELSKLHMYETYYDKLQLYFGQENIQLPYMHTDSFVLGLNTHDENKDSKNLENLFDFSKLNKKYELFRKKTKR